MPTLKYSIRSSVAAASSSVSSLRTALRRMRREYVERELEGCQMVAGLWCHSLTVRQIQCLRGVLPKSAKLIIAKNTLLGKSTQGTSWESIRSCARGMNAWLFVRSDDDVAATIKACRDFQRQWKLDLNNFTGAVFQGRLYGPQDFGILETSLTKADSNAYLLGSLHLPMASLLGLLQESQEGVGCADVVALPDDSAGAKAATTVLPSH